MTTRRQITELAGHTMDSQATTNQGRSRLAVGLRALAAMAVASALLAGCSTPVERQTTATGLLSTGDAQSMADQTRRFVSDVSKADLAIGGSTNHADTSRCLSRSADCRVRDLRSPWEARRYLMPNGTLSAPPASEAPR